MNDLPIGGNENDLVLEPGQDLVLRDTNGIERLRLDAATGTIRIRNGNGLTRILVDPDGGNIFVGGSGQDGDLLLFPSSADSFETADSTIHLNADGRSIGVGMPQRPGLVRVRGNAQQIDLVGERGDIIISGHLDLRTDGGELRARLSHDGTLVAGGAGRAGMVNVRNDSGATVIRLDLSGSEARGRLGGNGVTGRIELLDGDDDSTIVLNGATGNVGIGDVGGGNGGALFVKDENGDDAIVLNGEAGNVAVGSAAGGRSGAVFVKDDSGEDSIVLNGETANVALGRSGNGGDLLLKDDSGQDTIVIRGTTANLGLGRLGREGNVFVKNDEGENTIHLSGQTGDILLGNADCAEDFDVEEERLEPGDVLVIGDHGTLQRCRDPYDRRVAGIISGADGYRAGIVLDRRPSARARVPVALVGKVACKVDARHGAIRVGDLLTTSTTPGYAMKVTDPARGFGAVIGKSLGTLELGTGTVLVLVGLQ